MFRVNSLPQIQPHIMGLRLQSNIFLFSLLAVFLTVYAASAAQSLDATITGANIKVIKGLLLARDVLPRQEEVCPLAGGISKFLIDSHLSSLVSG
jgi:hypothetical protein